MQKVNKDLANILEKFISSQWDLIAIPSKEYLEGKIDDKTLALAIKKADDECGFCGCELDALYKKALLILNS